MGKRVIGRSDCHHRKQKCHQAGRLVKSPNSRARPVYLLLTILTVVLGLASRRFANHLPALLHKNAGDILWATMVFFLVALLLPSLSTFRVALIAGAFSLTIECLKLVQVDWLAVFRSKPIGHLIFGSVFSFTNLVCYALGILLGAATEWRIVSGRPIRR